eukprot:11282094-Heterocapsa_arctica.AAC.1
MLFGLSTAVIQFEAGTASPRHSPAGRPAPLGHVRLQRQPDERVDSAGQKLVSTAFSRLNTPLAPANSRQ